MNNQRLVFVLLCVALLSACGTPPVQQDQPVLLASGQGLAAIVLDTADPLEQVTFVSSDGNNKLSIASVPIGLNLYQFQVPAGDYCFTRFQFGRWNFFPTDKVQQFGCFSVKAGQLGYSGTLQPRIVNGEEMTRQQFEPESFRDLLAQHYPIVTKQFMASLTPPHATKAAIQIDPATAYDAYAYRTRFIYGIKQDGTP